MTLVVGLNILSTVSQQRTMITAIVDSILQQNRDGHEGFILSILSVFPYLPLQIWYIVPLRGFSTYVCLLLSKLVHAK